LIEKRHKARQAFFQCNTRVKRKICLKSQSSLQRYIREIKSNWQEEKEIELQMTADRRDMKALYLGLKETYGPKSRVMIHLRDHNGNTVLQENEKILEIISDYFNQLLNIPGELDKAAKTWCKGHLLQFWMVFPIWMSSCQQIAQRRMEKRLAEMVCYLWYESMVVKK